MEIDNKTILIIGLLLGGLVSMYLGLENLASAIYGGLVGYLSKDIPQEVYNKLQNNDLEGDVEDDI